MLGTGQEAPRRWGQAGSGVVLLALLALLTSVPTPAPAAGPPQIGDVWVSSVFATTARAGAEVDPDGSFTVFHYDYISKAAYEANLAAEEDGFAGAARVPTSVDAPVGSGSGFVVAAFTLSGLTPDTPYRYRIVVESAEGTEESEAQDFVSHPIALGPVDDTCPNKAVRAQQNTSSSPFLADCRAYEMVSPVDKNGGRVEPPGAIAGGGALQAATQGDVVTYGSSSSFAGGSGAPPASQYIARRGSSGWSTENITAPVFAGGYDAGEGGVPYRIFSPDLGRGLLLNGDHCRGGGEGCAVANPPLAGTTAPAGYQNYYRRSSSSGAFTALLRSADIAGFAVDPSLFDLLLAGSSPDLQHVILSTCTALTADAVEAPEGEGCDPEQPNLYASSGSGLSLINIPPGESTGVPGAALAAQAGAVSSDGSRVYWEDLASGNLYLRAGEGTKQVDEEAGGEGTFQVASADGSVAFFTVGGHLWRYLAESDSATDITPSGGVQGVLGASADGSVVYFQDGEALKRWAGGPAEIVAEGASAADPESWPPATGTARVTADGSHLAFVSSESLTGFDNRDPKTKEPYPQIFVYDGGLGCVSCNPTNGRPVGRSTIPGALANGTDPTATQAYKPRVLSDDGKRVFFDSADVLALTDTNNDVDVYQWEAQGKGSCTREGGCLSLISSGRSAGESHFVDASADGDDAFFLTGGSLIAGVDPGATDLYAARVGGGFLLPGEPIPCKGDACQVLPAAPVDPTLTTLLSGPGNPPVSYEGTVQNCAALARRGRRLVKRGKRVRRKARRARGRARRVKLRVRAADLVRQGRKARRSAQLCRQAERRAEK